MDKRFGFEGFVEDTEQAVDMDSVLRSNQDDEDDLFFDLAEEFQELEVRGD